MGIAMRGTINVDVSHALTVINRLQRQLSPENFNWCLEHTIKDTGNRAVKGIIKREVSTEYQVTQKWVGEKVRRAQYSGGGPRISCVIPIKGERGTLGGIFPASGGGLAAGRSSGTAAKKRLKRGGAKIKAKIVRGTQSQIPDKLGNQGGNPPFRLPNGAVMTRTTGKKKPIARVVGRAVPQMVDKQFERRIEQPINDYMIKRMDQLVKQRMGI